LQNRLLLPQCIQLLLQLMHQLAPFFHLLLVLLSSSYCIALL